MNLVIEKLVIEDSGSRWGSPYLCEQIKNKVMNTSADFLIVCSEFNQKILLQIEDYVTRCSENMDEADIHLFNQNHAFLQYLRKLPDENKYEMTEKLQFLDEISPKPVSTYLERDPHVLLEEMGSYILYNISFLKTYFEKAEERMCLIDIFQKAKMIWKHSVLEEIENNEVKMQVADNYTINDMIDCWDFYRKLEEDYTELSLVLLDFDKNFFNYLIRTKLGPEFQNKLINGELNDAQEALKDLTNFLNSHNKQLVSELISVGYFYLQIPVEKYFVWSENKPFSIAYLQFLKVLFDKTHYQSKQYYLKYYRRATNSVYKAVGLNSIKPIAKAYKLYYVLG
ncbi:hypothetical protein HCJ52_13070 [Listeria sp. FSL L7-1485]|uniref:Uncharacterized protein n=1 Tax=Listeria immobilis TaxID=2713502 RepID=A0A7X1C9E8_9LIST|nr:hypothetical protein [Listeria immobilis]MBC1489259.1 hypothetical protein [Listeria immobilis]MBC1517190.1 hypothetical protein [Listeria immobilis]MBC1537055.1 hypothetical protein [Listeria immobilis]